MLKSLNEQMARSVHLTDEQAALAIAQLIDGSVADDLKADFLHGLARKGETAEEISAFARELRAKSVVPPIDAATRAGTILDVCGTGGDRLNTFNISTTVALICASAGIPVAKHGNRAITSQSGSADVLEALGIKIELPPEAAAHSLREHHFAFFFNAPLIIRPSGISAPPASCAPQGAADHHQLPRPAASTRRGRPRNSSAFPTPSSALIVARRRCNPWASSARWW